MGPSWVYANILLAAALILSSNAVVLNVTTTEVEVGQTANVSMECFSSRLPSDVADVAIVRILKWELKEWNSVVERRGNNNNMEVRTNSEDAFVLTNYSSSGDKHESFLRLTWPLATIDTVGRYRCDVIAFTVQESVMWLKSQPVFISRKEVVTVQMLSQVVEENRRESLKQLLTQKQDILENVTTTVGALEADFQNTLKTQQQVLNQAVEGIKAECLRQLHSHNMDILHNVTSSVEASERKLVHQLATQKQDMLENVKASVWALEASFESRMKNQLQVWELAIKQDILDTMTSTVGAMKEVLERKIDALKSQMKPNSCADIQGLGPRPVVVLRSGLQVVCDTVTDNGGWILIQRRTSGDVNFLRGWADYRNGFGDFSGNFWFGLEKIYQLTSQEKFQLRFDVEYKGFAFHAVYDEFSLSGEDENYTIQISGFSGNVADEMAYHNGLPFSTKDRDNDSFESYNCAKADHGAWWYKSCHRVNLNGEWASTHDGEGLIWDSLTGRFESVTLSEIKIRPRPCQAR
ncbi:fibrinogen C domain-containing protein 1 [Aplysia californica]|uniref:Fibrinogen C domain-containing protein 1 n=1 Tax=Aplysia californica TaxID=6500 RepID=A0ABM0ZYQ5_APLCA|nr:fibrinogen C domain-containing protein 1 [Aplysia californica]